MNDRQLAAAVRSKDERAINHVINKYSRLLWTVVSSALASHATAEETEECVADVFIYFWQNPERYDPERGKLKTWLCIVARSKALDRYRVLSRQSTEELDAARYILDSDITERLISRENIESLHSALQMLDETDKEILIRRYYHQQKPAEISVAMDLSSKQVENRLYRSKQKLRSILSEKGVS